MISFVALPLIAALVLASFASSLLGHLGPAAAARGHAILIAGVGVAAVPTLWLVGLSGLAHAGVVNPITDWSTHLLPGYRPLGAVVGGVSLAMALGGTVGTARLLIQHRRVRSTDTDPLVRIHTDQIFAYTLPGPARTIAISDGLSRSLDVDEFNFVIAHERAHAHHRHDRYKLLALLTTTFVPPVAALTRRLEFHLERWADEVALETTGTDRRFAARTIAKVALAGNSPRSALGIADHGIAARATAMLGPAESAGPASRAFTFTMIATTLGLAIYQMHHTAMFAAELTR